MNDKYLVAFDKYLVAFKNLITSKELQIRGGIEDNSKIISLISQLLNKNML